ncbi:MAG: ribose 5-phosphate isomerase B [Anaerolineaceae bacterium]|nr:ribose 5-phosphate isomerase B [Anaerolineaceae bacterium]
MKLAVGGDHAGFPLKGPLVAWLQAEGHTITDHGTHSTDPVDFPDIARLVTDQVRSGDAERGLLVCGTGVGAAIAGNKTPGIRAAVCHDVYSAHQCVEHDNVNLLCIGAQIVGEPLAKELVAAFLAAQFSTEVHFRRRVEKLHELERRSAEEILKGDQAS